MIDFIFDNIYVLIILAGVVAQWVKSQKEAKEERQIEEARRRAIAQQAAGEYDFEEEIEAREPQYPRGSITPPPLPAVEVSATPAPQLENFADELARQQNLLNQVSELKRAKREKRNAPPAPLHSYEQPPKPVSTKSISRRLFNRSELRQTIVVKEVLDKPLSLR